MQLDVSEHLPLFLGFSIKEPIRFVVNTGVYHLCFSYCSHLLSPLISRLCLCLIQRTAVRHG